MQSPGGCSRHLRGLSSETWGPEPQNQSLVLVPQDRTGQDRTRSPSPTPASRTQWDLECPRAEISLQLDWPMILSDCRVPGPTPGPQHQNLPSSYDLHGSV